MRQIEKQPPPFPAILNDWIDRQLRGRQHLTYKRFKKSGNNGRDFRAILIAEQFGLCAYTGLSLTMAAISGTESRYEPHTEHIKPAALCRADVGGDPKSLCCELDYHNMVATINVISDLPNEYFGSRKKWDGYDPINFVSPTLPTCESAFFYGENGEVTASTEPGDYTIKLLELNHTTLVQERLGEIQYYFPDENFPDDTRLLQIIDEVTVPNEGRLPAFAFVIKQIAQRFLPE